MAIVAAGAIREYYGLSGDVKPTAPPDGSRFYETDTQTWYVFDGSTWDVYAGALAGTTATTLADGADATLGHKADAKNAATDTTAITVMQVLKEISYLLQNPIVETPSGFTALNITDAAAHNAIKTGAGVFHGVSINTIGVTSSATIYDGLTNGGTKIATISTLAQGTVTLDAAFSTGLTVVTAGGSPADITVLYK